MADNLPTMHGRTHVPSGYAVQVQAYTDAATLLPAASSDQLHCITSTIGAYDSAIAYDAVVTGTSSISNATLTTIVFDNCYVSIGATAFAIDTAVPTTDPFKILKDGWYIVGLNFEYSGTFTDVRYFLVEPDFTPETRNGMSGKGLVSEISSPYERECNATWLAYFTSHSGTNTFRCKVRQDSGVGQAVVAVNMFAVYLGADIDTDWPRPF